MGFDVDVSRRLGDREIACRIPPNPGVTALLGRSGAGKSSALNMIAGLLRPDVGRVVVGGRTLFGAGVDLPPEQRRAGYVFQDARLFPHLRVRENLTYGAPKARLLRGKSRSVARGSGFSTSLETNGERLGANGEGLVTNGVGEGRLDFLGIDYLLDRWPGSLSGGEAKRVAIGRALLSDPDFLLLDEPLASLDRARREEVMAALEHLRDHAGLPILLVTHDRAEAERLAGRQVVELD